MATFYEVIKRLENKHFYPLAKGIEEHEVRIIMQAQGVKRLPELYRDLLLCCGREGAARFYPTKSSGNENLYRDLLSAKEGIQSAMSFDETTNPLLPEDAFVFVEDLDLYFAFFLTDNDNDDPPVYEYFTDKEAPKITYVSLSAYFLHEIDRRKREIEKQRQRRKAEHNLQILPDFFTSILTRLFGRSADSDRKD